MCVHLNLLKLYTLNIYIYIVLIPSLLCEQHKHVFTNFKLMLGMVAHWYPSTKEIEVTWIIFRPCLKTCPSIKVSLR